MDLNKIGKFIETLRKNKNLTQVQLAELIGSSDKTISKWEKGNGFPDIAYQTKLCSVLDIFLEELHEGEFNIERRKRHKRRKIINRIVTIYAAITIPLIIFLCLFFINNYDATKIYKINSREDKVKVTINGTLIETNKISMIYIGNITLWNYDIKDSDIISVEIYSDDKLIFHTNTLQDIIVKYGKELNKDDLEVKITITNNKKEDTVYNVKLDLTNITKDHELKAPEISKVKILSEEQIVKNLKKAGFKQQTDHWELINKDSKYEERIVYYPLTQKLTYDSNKSDIAKNILFNANTRVLTTCIYNQTNDERILFEKYNYDYDDESLDCQVGVCSTTKNVLKTMEKYITLLIVE